MKTSFFALIGLTFPNSETRMTHLGAEVFDTNGDLIGYFSSELFILRKEYAHYSKAVSALTENGVDYEVKGDADALYS